jgi:3-methyladenine DNA glycosylase AlkD
MGAERVDAVLAQLRRHARPQELAGMARFGLTGAGRLGVSVPVMRRLARELGTDHALAQALWDSGIPEARILASMVAEPAALTARQMDAWARDFASWDVCDQTCLNAFCRSPLAWRKVQRWSASQHEFVRRAAFSLLAALSVHDKQASNDSFVEALALVEAAADDERNFVKKAVNWALRTIGKRNLVLHQAAIEAAQRMQQQGSRCARWIAADALRELRSAAVLARLQQRA